MNKRTVLAITATLLILFLTVFLLKVEGEEEPFKQVELSTENSAITVGLPAYVDTIVLVGLEQIGLKGITVNVAPLSDAARANFDGELKGHVRYFNGQYYMYLASGDRKDFIDVISHELVHVQQYQSGEFVYIGATYVQWRGVDYDLETADYNRRPWENDAFDKQSDVSNKIESVLY